MSKQQKVVVLAVALAGQVYLGKVVKQQAVALGLSVGAVALAGMIAGAVLG